MRRHLLAGLVCLASLVASGCGESLPSGGSGDTENGCKPTSGSQLTSLEFATDAVSMAPGARAPVKVNAVYSDGCTVDATNAVYLTVDSGAVARVGRDTHFDGSAVRWVEGVSTGTAELIASTQKNASGVVSSPLTVTVTECSGENTPISDMYAMPSMMKVAVGESERIRVFAVWESGCVFDATPRVYLTVANESVARVDAMTTVAGGRQVTGLSEGTTTVVASVKAGGEGMRAPEVTVQVVPEGQTTPGGGGNNPSNPENPETPVDPPVPDPNPDPQTVTLKSLTIYPEDLSLSPVDRMPITVVASWSDGTTRDVTKEASLTSSNPAVGKVVTATMTVDPSTTYVEAVSNGTTEITASWSDGKESASGSRTMTVAARTTETRGMWVHRWGFGSTEASARALIRRIAEHGFNAVFFQVMGDGRAYYNSQLLPRIYTSWDPLAVAIDEAHKQGIQLHAYINAMVGPDSIPSTTPAHILASHPEWKCRNASGTVQNGDGYTWVAPTDGYIEHFSKIVKEIVSNYEVDGIHIDRIRTPGTGTCYDGSGELKALYESMKASGAVSDWPEFMRGRIGKVVENAYRQVVAIRPAAMVSVAAWGIYKKFSGCGTSEGYGSSYNQDTIGWLEQGIVDALVPMTYWDIGTGCTDWARHADFFQANSHGRQIIMGMNGVDSGKVNTGKMIARINYARSISAAGTSIYSSAYFSSTYTDDVEGAWDAFLNGPYAAEADPTPIVHR